MNPGHVATLKTVINNAAFRDSIDDVAGLSLRNQADRASLQQIVDGLGGSGVEIRNMARARQKLLRQMVILELPGLSSKNRPADAQNTTNAESHAISAALRELQALDDIGLLSPGLVHRFAVAHDSVQRWASSSRSKDRMHAAEHIGALAAAAQSGALPDDVLGLDSRMDDTARALARHGAFQRGEPKEIADARAELAVAGRRLAFALQLRGNGNLGQSGAGRQLDGNAHKSGAQIFLNGGPGDVAIDGRFTAALRGAFGDNAGRDVGLLVANVALLQRKVAPYNMLANAQAKYERISTQRRNVRRNDPGYAVLTFRRRLAKATVKQWKAVIAHDDAVARRDSLKLQPSSAGRNRALVLAEREVRTRAAALTSQQSPMARAMRDFRNASGAIDQLLGKKRMDRMSVKEEIAAVEREVENRMRRGQTGQLSGHYDELKSLHQIRKQHDSDITRLQMLKTTAVEILKDQDRLKHFTVSGMDGAELQKLGLDQSDRAHVQAAIGQYIKSGLRSPDQIQRTTAQINKVVRRLARDPSAKKVMGLQVEKTDQRRANTFLNTLFRSVSGKSDEFNLQADDPVVKNGFNAQLRKLIAETPGNIKGQLKAYQASLANHRAKLERQSNRILHIDVGTKQAADALQALSQQHQFQLTVVGKGAMTSVQPPSIIDASRKFVRAVQLKRQMMRRRNPSSDLTKRYNKALSALQRTDLRALNVSFGLPKSDADALLGHYAMGDSASYRAALAVVYIADTAPAMRSRAEQKALRHQNKIDEILVAREELLGPKFTGFVRNMVRAATLAARPQALDPDYERFDRFDASLHRQQIETTLRSWGLQTDTFRSEIDSVVFNVRALSNQEVGSSFGAAVADESISTVELGQWNRELDQNLTALDIKAPTQNSKAVDQMLDAVRAMPIQGKIELTLERDANLKFAVDIPAGKKKNGEKRKVGVGVEVGGHSAAVLEIKRSTFDYEIRLRSNKFGAQGSLGVQFFGVNGAISHKDGVSIHFKDADTAQNFLKKVLTGERVTIADWSNNGGVESTKKTTKGLAADVSFDLPFPVYAGFSVVGSGSKDSTTYQTSTGSETKHRSVYGFRIQGSIGSGVAAPIGGPLNIGVSVDGWLAKEGILIDRKKFEYADDGLLKGAEYFRAVSLVSRDLDTMLKLADDSKQTRAMLDRQVDFGGANKTYGQRMKDMLATGTQNDTFVVEYKLDKSVVQAINDLQTKMRTAPEPQKKELKSQISALLSDRANYRPKGAMLNPVRFDSESKGWDLAFVNTTKEAIASTRFSAGFAPAPEPQKSDQPKLVQA